MIIKATIIEILYLPKYSVIIVVFIITRFYAAYCIFSMLYQLLRRRQTNNQSPLFRNYLRRIFIVQILYQEEKMNVTNWTVQLLSQPSQKCVWSVKL